MKDYLICKINLFDKHQAITVLHYDGTSRFLAYTDVDSLATALTDAYESTGIHSIRLIGNPVFASQIAQSISTNITTKFNNNDLEIEVIKDNG